MAASASSKSLRTTRPGSSASEEERRLLERAIGRWVTGGVHHVGSTSVPGLDAKPIIDILVGVESLTASQLKRELAEQHRTDRDAYTEGKAAFIADVLERA